MSQKDFHKKLRILQKDSDRLINEMQGSFFESLKKALSEHLSEQQINELLEGFKPPFDRLRATMRKHWETEFTAKIKRRENR